MARIRLPGGRITPAQLRALATIAETSQTQTLELTSRGSVQLRGVRDAARLARTAAATGLVPSVAHDRVRNIAASPLSGRTVGRLDVRPMVDALELELRSDPVFADLPGRLWFGIDDGRGDVSGLDTDIGVHAIDDRCVALLLAGNDTGVRLSLSDAVPAMVELARRFQRIRGTFWRVAELDDSGMLVKGMVRGPQRLTFDRAVPPPVGWFEQRDGAIAVGAAVPLGVLSVSVALTVASMERPLVITPWRTLLVCDLDCVDAVRALQTLSPMGLVFDRKSPWARVSACTGLPGCRHSAADVRADLTAAVLAGDAPRGRQHWVGCPRACGSPSSGDVMVASPVGYRLLTTKQ